MLRTIIAILLLSVVLTGCFTPSVHHRTVRRKPDYGYQVGEASWYGPKFNGRKTSSGDVYDMYNLTAAHPSLPFDTVVRVTSFRNGRSVVVRINDRGPFLKGRIIDLSYAAAARLGMLGEGVTKVRVDIL